MKKESRFIIVLAGGIGVRYGGEVSKQFQKINGVPVIVKTLKKILALFRLESIRLVVNPDHRLFWIQIEQEYPFIKGIPTVSGGEQRYHSVQNALDTINSEDTDLIGVHDGVRPFVSYSTIINAFETANRFGTAVPYFDAVNTIRIEREGDNRAIDRKAVKIVQNPQVFRSAIIKKAYCNAYRPDFLDDATVVEHAGHKINLCLGNYENIKITHPQDIVIAEALDIFMDDFEQNTDGYLYGNRIINHSEEL